MEVGWFEGKTVLFWEIWECKTPATAVLGVQELSQGGIGGSEPHEKHF